MMLTVMLCILGARDFCDIYTNDTVCSGISNSTHGDWSTSVKDGAVRCELKCSEGYAPDKCNVLIDKGNGTWDRDIPNCVKEPWTNGYPGKVVISLVTGVGLAIGLFIAIHILLYYVGFTPRGVRRKSCSACIQRAGVKGCAWPVNVTVFIAAIAATLTTLCGFLGNYCT
ncbi:uncharacterized protein LOC127832620 isoform X2 [Dreissena polymorpha]|uniref:uncharacterized protein LOC127832620 isoform X2 n=1 Tax=Dreissena polymorpha TaxID=45954 RepID=UPI002264DA9E|nr:uncharacterized protein LOC127832620 isoform X2 [Dreissena polymorpha]